MGKASRKMKKKHQQGMEAGLQADVKETEQKLFRQIEEESYSDALDTLVELVQKKSVSPQAMYAGAYAYFMMGDYDRSAKWIDNTLRYAPNHVAARILLARLCILQEKVDAGLAIFDLLTDKFLDGLSDDERDEIETIAGFYGRNESEKVKRDYPHLAAFLHVGEDEEEAGTSDMAESVSGLKLPSFEEEKTAEPQVSSSADEKQQTQKPEAGKSALEVLRSLKAKIDARMHGEDAAAVQSSTAAGTSAGTTDLNMGTETADNEARESFSQPCVDSGISGEARDRLKEICEGKHPIAEKVRLLNSFAGGYYAQGNMQDAELFLTEALKFDETDEQLLRNLAVLLAEKGDKDKAFQVAARMRQTNFLLLNAIREM
ncbi:MAG: CDC27 family protein [Schwartzia sp.]|nr:CDC27 family protein [Schwartzia sp. (in: firmicutes)]